MRFAARMIRGGFAMIALTFAMLSMPCWATEKKYSPGASDDEIKIGQTMSYSGPNSPFAVVGQTFDGYFRKVNDEGGIGGRKIKFISYDDSFNPAKTVEQTRRLIESDEVLFTVGSLGTALQFAVQRYMNAKKVPQLFINGASSRWEDPKKFPWTMGYTTSYRAEGRIYARWILRDKPDAKIAIIYQNDDYGRDLLAGVKEGLGESIDDRRRGELRNYRTYNRHPHRQTEVFRCRRIARFHSAKICRAGDTQGGRNRVEATPRIK